MTHAALPLSAAFSPRQISTKLVSCGEDVVGPAGFKVDGSYERLVVGPKAACLKSRQSGKEDCSVLAEGMMWPHAKRSR
jgi:hypothetical protein